MASENAMSAGVFARCAKIPTLAVGSQAAAALRGETEPSRFVKQNASFFPKGRPQKRAPFGALFMAYPKVIPYVGIADVERKAGGASAPW